MKITIHRGTHQIGGTVTEISTEKSRIFIDFGEELPPVNSDKDWHSQPMEIRGLTKGKPNCDGVFFTHAHGDHIGMYKNLLPEIPLYMGAASKEIFLAIQNRVKYVKPELKDKIPLIENAHTFKANEEIIAGDIKVKPFLVDHSAYDAYMFLIEAEGKKILHTGDFRTHGFRGKKLPQMLEAYVKQVDLILCEGTMLSRDVSEQKVKCEAELKHELYEYYSKYKYVFIMCSSTNIDRIAAAHSIARRESRLFLCDSYQKEVLNIVTKYGAEHTNLYNFNAAEDYTRINPTEAANKGFVMLVRPSSDKFKEIMAKYKGENSIILYSMWKGYLDKYRDFMEGFKYEYWHTSGHATPTAIKMLCDTVKPRIGVVPMHTEAPEEFSALVSPYEVLYLKDNEEMIM